MGVEVIRKGPMFDGRAWVVLRSAIHEIVEAVADYGENAVRAQLHDVLKHPTGYYESRIQTDRVSPDVNVINDGNVIYGPWLEGVGSRNRTTRFKGYRTFRQTTQKVKAAVTPIATEVMAKHIGEMN